MKLEYILQNNIDKIVSDNFDHSLRIGKYTYGSLFQSLSNYPLDLMNLYFFDILKKNIIKNPKLTIMSLSLKNYWIILTSIIKIKDYYNYKKKDLMILELGSYLGFFVDYLYKLGFINTYGIDNNFYYIKISRKLGISNVFCKDICKINVNLKKKFDVVLSVQVIHKDLNLTLTENLFLNIIKNSFLILRNSGFLFFVSDSSFFSNEKKIKNIIFDKFIIVTKYLVNNKWNLILKKVI